MNRTRMMMIVLAATLLTATPLLAQMPGDYGDAPEGALAYPVTGVIGAFPTCINVGPAGWVVHGPIGWAFFGPMVDFEPDGNAGTCPMFAPYDLDECFADPDAGLLHPPAYTIVGNQVVTCAGANGSLGPVCTNAQWGPTLDIHVVNTMPVVGYVNVVFDWDLNGAWGGSNQYHCNAPEHVLVNFPVPVGFVGPLSALAPPPFLVGGNPGHVWSRFTISETPVPVGWDGSGSFEDGESEDYLLLVDDSIATETTDWGHIKSMFH